MKRLVTYCLLLLMIILVHETYSQVENIIKNSPRTIQLFYSNVFAGRTTSQGMGAFISLDSRNNYYQRFGFYFGVNNNTENYQTITSDLYWNETRTTNISSDENILYLYFSYELVFPILIGEKYSLYTSLGPRISYSLSNESQKRTFIPNIYYLEILNSKTNRYGFGIGAAIGFNYALTNTFQAFVELSSLVNTAKHISEIIYESYQTKDNYTVSEIRRGFDVIDVKVGFTFKM